MISFRSHLWHPAVSYLRYVSCPHCVIFSILMMTLFLPTLHVLYVTVLMSHFWHSFCSTYIWHTSCPSCDIHPVPLVTYILSHVWYFPGSSSDILHTGIPFRHSFCFTCDHDILPVKLVKSTSNTCDIFLFGPTCVFSLSYFWYSLRSSCHVNSMNSIRLNSYREQNEFETKPDQFYVL